MNLRSTESRIIAQGELADGGGFWYVKVTQLNIFQAIAHQWHCKFGKYRKHYLVVTDEHGNKIDHPLNTNS